MIFEICSLDLSKFSFSEGYMQAPINDRRQQIEEKSHMS